MTTKITGTNTAAAPGITGDDTDTGLVYGTDSVSISTGGTTRTTVNSSGHLLPGAADTYDLGANTTPWRNIWMENDLYIEDNGMAVFGTGEDLKIYYDGSHSYIKGNGAACGGIIIDNSADADQNIEIKAGQDVYLKTHDGSHTSIRCERGGAVQLHHNNTIKAQTHSTGFLVDGGYLRACNDGNFTNLDDTSHGLRVINNNWGLRVVNSHASTPYGIHVLFNNSHPDDSSSRFFVGQDDQTSRIIIYSDGDIQNHDGSYGTTSDVKLKENIVDANSQWDDIKAVRVRNFNFKISPDKKHIGVVAQELETVCPGLVKNNPDLDENNKDLGTTTKSVKSSILYMKAVKALQEAMARIETLETKVAALEAG